tara:strand:+ start:1378 stop:1941 length:564 start_codon:yes stop_codon:yes gene_type:complete
MKNFKSALLILASIAFIISFIGLHKSAKQDRINKEIKTQNTLDSLQHHIDSLQYVNDSLIEQYQLFDIIIEPVNYMIDVIDAIMEVESSHNDSAYNAYEDAVGCLQIRKCMVDDVNRILKRQGTPIKYTYNDRWVRRKSLEMFHIYCGYYKLNTAEEIARCWNGGPRGINNPATVIYWNKVQDKINS